MNGEAVEVQLLDGVCQTTRETLERVRIPWMVAGRRNYIGRQKVEFEYILDVVRDGDEGISDPAFYEAGILYGLFQEPTGRVVLLNVGGVLFHLREAVARRIPYLDSTIRWHHEKAVAGYIDLSKTFLDRNPTKFVGLLAHVESGVDTSWAVKKEALFWGVDCAEPQECRPVIDAAGDAGPVMNAVSFADAVLSDDPTVTVHRRNFVRKSRSAFTFHTVRQQPRDGRWEAVITKADEGLGDCWLQLDLRVRFEELPTDSWGLCCIVQKVDVKLDYCSESFSGPDLYMFLVINRIARPTVVATSADTCRLTIGLPTYWWRALWIKPAVHLVMDGCVITSAISPEWEVVAAAVIYTSWQRLYQRVEDMRAGGIMLRHSTTQMTVNCQAPDVTYCHPLLFKNPTKDIIVAVTGGRCDPVLSIELVLDGRVYMALDGTFSRTVLAQHMYDIADNREPVYFLPFDFGTTDPVYNTSTCNLSQCKDVHLKLRLLPGQYTIFIMARSVNEVRHIDSRLCLTFTP